MLSVRVRGVVAGVRSSETQRDLIDNFQAVAIERDDFARMIGEDADAAQAEVDQNLRADSAFALHLALCAEVVASFFAVVKTDTRQLAVFGLVRGIAQHDARIDLKSPAGVMQIYENPAPRFGDCRERTIDGRVAIARRGTERIAGEAMRVDTD